MVLSYRDSTRSRSEDCLSICRPDVLRPSVVDPEGRTAVGHDEGAGHAEEVELVAIQPVSVDGDELALVLAGQDGQLELPAPGVDLGGIDDEDVVGAVGDH